MNSIGKFLRLVRREQGLTQEQLVEQLALSVKEFDALNAVTLSRWETGTTSPSFKKKRELLKFCVAQRWLSTGPCHDFVRNRFEKLCEPLEGIFKHNYETLIANVPRLRIPLNEYVLQDLQQKSATFYYEHIVDIETAGNPQDYYTVSPDSLQGLCHFPSSYSLLCERKKQHLGHFIMFKLNNDAAQRLVHNQLNENHISTNDLCSRADKGSYYIHARTGSIRP